MTTLSGKSAALVLTTKSDKLRDKNVGGEISKHYLAGPGEKKHTQITSLRNQGNNSQQTPPSLVAFYNILSEDGLGLFHDFWSQHADGRWCNTSLVKVRSITLCFNGHFPGEPGLASVY